MLFEYKKKIVLFISILMLFLLMPIAAAELEPLKVSYGYEPGIESIDFSPDDQFIVSGYYKGSVRIWNTVEGENISYTPNLVEKERLMPLFCNVSPYLKQVVFSPDGQYVLVTSSDYNYENNQVTSAYLSVYNVESGEIIRSHNLSTSYLWEVAFSPDGKTYAALSEMSKVTETSTISLWDLESGDITRDIENNNYRLTSLAFSPDGKYLIASFYNNINPDRIVIFDLENGTAIKSIEEPSVSNIQFSDDGRIFAARSNHKSEVIVWNSDSFTELCRPRGLKAPPSDIALSPDGKYLVAVEGDNIMGWNISSKELFLNVYQSDQINSYGSVDFSNDGRYIAIGALLQDGSKYVMDFDTRSEAFLNIKDYRDIPLSNGAVFIYDFQDIRENEYKEGFLDLLLKTPFNLLLVFIGVPLIFILLLLGRLS
jgi:WD40 repeat protein